MANPSSASYKIFVAGIPTVTPDFEVLKYFRRFGDVVWIDRSRGNPSQTEEDHRNHCILYMRDKASVNAVLRMAPHAVGGRRVMCKEYLEGSQLFRQNLDYNRRRVILKKVPADLSEAQVRRYLEQAFGEIDTMFCFLPESNKDRKFHQRQYRSYSVMFKLAQSANQAALAKIIYLKDQQRTIVERFKKSKQVARQVWQTKARKMNSLELIPGTVTKKRSLSFFAKENNLDSNNKLKDRSSRAYSSEGEGTYDRTGCKRHQFASHLVDICSRIKPTSKIYSKIRQEDFSYLASFHLKNSWTGLNNIRLNPGRHF